MRLGASDGWKAVREILLSAMAPVQAWIKHKPVCLPDVPAREIILLPAHTTSWADVIWFRKLLMVRDVPVIRAKPGADPLPYPDWTRYLDYTSVYNTFADKTQWFEFYEQEWDRLCE